MTSVPPSPFPPEVRLVLLSAGADGVDVARRMEPLLAAPLSWPLVFVVAEREKAVSRLHHLLQRHHEDRVPADVLAGLGRLARVEAFRAMVLEDRMDALLEALASEGIQVLVLKGAALARTAYPSFAERPMGDVDLRVAPADAPGARRVAESMGWRVAADIIEANYPESEHHHLPPMDDGTALKLGLDLHTRLSSLWEPEGFGADDLLARSRPFPRPVSRLGAGAEEAWIDKVRVPDPADLLLHVCHHFGWSHTLAFGGWKSFRDAQVLVDHPELDAEAFRARVERARAGTLVYWTFRLAREVAGARIPDAMVDPFAPRLPVWVRERLLRHYVSGLDGGGGELPGGWRPWAWELGIQPDRLGVGPIRPWSNNAAFRHIRPPTPSRDGTAGGRSIGRARARMVQVLQAAHHLRWVLLGRSLP